MGYRDFKYINLKNYPCSYSGNSCKISKNNIIELSKITFMGWN